MRRVYTAVLSLVVVGGVFILLKNQEPPSAKIQTVAQHETLMPSDVELATEPAVTETKITQSEQAGSEPDSGFVTLDSAELRRMSRVDLEFYLSDFNFTYQNYADFEQRESILLNEVFYFAPEVAVRYLTDYRANPESRPMVFSTVVADLFQRHSESDLKEAFNRYLDTYNQLPAGWFMAEAMRTEVTQYIQRDDRSAIPSVVVDYAIKGFLNGDVSNYLTITFLGLRGNITDEQLIDVFLQTSAMTVGDGVEELIFDVLALKDARTFEHLLEFMRRHPKKLTIYRSLAEIEGVEVNSTVHEMMRHFAALTDVDKIYVSIMALDSGDKRALQYLLTHPVKQLDGPVLVNVDYLLKRRVTTPESEVKPIDWALDHLDALRYDSITQTFGID